MKDGEISFEDDSGNSYHYNIETHRVLVTPAFTRGFQIYDPTTSGYDDIVKSEAFLKAIREYKLRNYNLNRKNKEYE